MLYRIILDAVENVNTFLCGSSTVFLFSDRMVRPCIMFPDPGPPKQTGLFSRAEIFLDKRGMPV